MKFSEIFIGEREKESLRLVVFFYKNETFYNLRNSRLLVLLIIHFLIRAAPYDFRFGPQSQQVYFDKLRMLIEETFVKSDSKRVSLVTHSMGGLLCLYFLQSQSQEWLQQYVHSFIPLNTPWRGAVILLNTYARFLKGKDRLKI